MAARLLCREEIPIPVRLPGTTAPPAVNRADTAALAPTGGREASQTPAEAGSEAAAGAGSEQQQARDPRLPWIIDQSIK
jgi:hypothetical protein